MTDKQTLRKTLLAARKLRHAQAPELAAQNLVEVTKSLEFATAQTIAAYLPFGSEIEVRPLMQFLASQAHALCLPFCESREAGMVFRHFAFGDALAADGVGMHAPLSVARMLFSCRFWALTAKAIDWGAARGITTKRFLRCAKAAHLRPMAWAMTCKWLTNARASRMTKP
jgi:hypothetical protein